MSPETFPEEAVMVVEPTPMSVAMPCEPTAFDMTATAGLEELQATDDVMVCVAPLERVPTAANCTVPKLIVKVGFVGAIAIDVRTAGPTVTVAWFEVTPAKAAVILVVPDARAVANPLLPAVLLIVADWVLAEDQVTDAVIS